MMRRLFVGLFLSFGLALPLVAQDAENTLVIEVEGAANGVVEIELLPDVAPQHVDRIKTLAREGAYDGVVFHRVIDGFMAQTGDVEFGTTETFPEGRAGTGGSQMSDLPAEFSDMPFERGVLGMARSRDPDSANSQFFIMLEPAPHLNNQYTAFGRVISGQDVVDQISRGEGQNGIVTEPDIMRRVFIKADG